VHADSSSMKMIFPSTSKAMGISIPVYKLQVISRVPVSAVCDSIVFGMVNPSAFVFKITHKCTWTELLWSFFSNFEVAS